MLTAEVMRLIRNGLSAYRYYRAYLWNRLPSGFCEDPTCSHLWDDHILVGDGFMDDEDWDEEEDEITDEVELVEGDEDGETE